VGDSAVSGQAARPTGVPDRSEQGHTFF